MIPIFPNPFDPLGSVASKIVYDGWTAAMLGIWNAGLWLLQLVLNLGDMLLTPDLREGGPGAGIYRTAFWIAGALVLILGIVQIGTAAVRRDGRSLARVGIGLVQFAVVWAGWLAYGVVLIAATSGLTRSLMRSLLNADAWSAIKIGEPFGAGDITDATVATVLGFMGFFVVIAAIGHFLVLLARAAALMVLAATTPIAAAGLIGDAGRAWFWKSLRWFHAAAFAPVVMVLVFGLANQFTTGIATGLGKNFSAIGTSVVGVVLILISVFSPLALFRLLAFVDPGTSSGAAMRAGLAANGGLQGLLSPRTADGGAATRTDEQGRTSAEGSAEAQTTSRFANSASGAMKALGPVGQVAATGLGVMATIGTRGASMGADLTSQMGVGHQVWPPDLSPQARKASQTQDSRQDQNDSDGNPPPDVTEAGPDNTPPAPGNSGAPPTLAARPTVGATPAGGALASGGTAAGGGEAATAAAAAAL